MRLLAEVLAEEAAVLPAKSKVDKTVLERLAEVDRVLLPGFAVIVEGRAGVCLAVLSRTLVVELDDRREVVNVGHVLVDSADLRWISPSPTEKAPASGRAQGPGESATERTDQGGRRPLRSCAGRPWLNLCGGHTPLPGGGRKIQNFDRLPLSSAGPVLDAALSFPPPTWL